MAKKGDSRAATGVVGFDELIQGGFPRNSSVLVCGGPGTGKSIFCMQFLINGATKYGEKGMYLTFEQSADALRNQSSQFGVNLESLEKKGKIKIISVPVEQITPKTIEMIEDVVKKSGIKRLVVDSLSTLVVNAPIYTTPSELAVKDVVGENIVFSPPIIGDYIVKRFVYDFIERLRKLDSTNILISEASQNGEYITRDTLSEFVCDGIVFLSLQEMLNMRRIQVKKMRETIHALKAKEFMILKNGIEVVQDKFSK
jgi:KaiC/GvpD/RAD55 family RecA-like ATPase